MNQAHSPQTLNNIPHADANITESGITYSRSESLDAYAFSCAFKKEFLEKISAIIAKEYPDIEINDLRIEYKEENDDFKIEIILEATELKLNYEHYAGTDKHLSKLKKITSKILAL